MSIWYTYYYLLRQQMDVNYLAGRGGWTPNSPIPLVDLLFIHTAFGPSFQIIGGIGIQNQFTSLLDNV